MHTRRRCGARGGARCCWQRRSASFCSSLVSPGCRGRAVCLTTGNRWRCSRRRGSARGLQKVAPADLYRASLPAIATWQANGGNAPRGHARVGRGSREPVRPVATTATNSLDSRPPAPNYGVGFLPISLWPELVPELVAGRVIARLGSGAHAFSAEPRGRGRDPMGAMTSLVLFSAGQDSTVCLAWALQRFARVETIGFAYGQRHSVEMAQRPLVRAKLAEAFPAWASRLGEDHVLELATLSAISDTALTRQAEFRMTAAGLPNTF